MPIRVSCPSCRVPLDILEKLQGKQIRCPQCHHVFVFDGTAEPAGEPSPALAAAEERVSVVPTDPPPVSGRAAATRRFGEETERPPRSRESSGGLLLVLGISL